MKIKISKSQWELIGDKAGWIKTASSNHKVFDSKKEALKFLSDNALMSVGWKAGNSMMEACYWNGKVYITKDNIKTAMRDLPPNVGRYEDANIPKIPGYYLIKENQRWGYCPTYRNETNKDDVVFLDKGKLLNWEEMKVVLKDEWRPVRQDDVNWFMANLGE